MKSDKEKAEISFNRRTRPAGFISLKFILLLASFLVFILPLISAVAVSMNTDFAQSETFLAKFSGNFYDQITGDSVHFYRNTATSNEIPMTFDVVKIENDFYVYALLENKQPGNYSIKVENVRYYQATQIIDDDIVSNFTISEETAQFSINPGVISVSDDFTVELQNLQDNSITIEINNPDSINSLSSINLNTGEKKIVSFVLDSTAEKSVTKIDFISGNTSYSMPVYLDITNTEQETNRTLEENFDMEFQPKTTEVSMATGSDTKRIIYLKNTGVSVLEDIFFNVSSLLESYVIVLTEKINSLAPGEIEQVELEIFSGSEEVIIEGRIIAYTDDVFDSFTLILNLSENFVPAEPEAGEDSIIVSACEDLDGIICGSNLACSGEIKRTRNGDCCVPPLVCQEPKKSYTKTIIGWGLLVLVFLIIIWFFKRKYRGVSRIKPF